MSAIPEIELAAEDEMKSADELIAELDALGLHFVIGDAIAEPAQSLSPAGLLAALAQQTDARLRMALIALLLYRPELAAVVLDALNRLNESAQISLKLLYTAAALLQRIHAERLHRLLGQWEPLPDLFSQELGISPAGSPRTQLRRLSERHRALAGLAANWMGTYEYAAERLMIRLEREAEWAV